MQASLLYWFAAQQHTSTLKRQKSGLFHAKYSKEFNETSHFFLKASEKDWKMANTKVVQENTNSRLMKTNG